MARISHRGSIRKRGKDSWEVRLTVGGERHTFTFRGAFTHAASFANTKYDEIAREYERVRMGLPGDMPFEALIRRFRKEYMPGLAKGTKRSYNDALKPIEWFFAHERKDMTVRKMSKGHVSAFLAWRRGHRLNGKGTITEGQVAERTIQKERTVLHTLMQYSVDQEIRDINPVALTKAPKAPKRTPVLPDAAKYERLLAETKKSRQPMLYLYVLTLGEAGLRSESEALWLRWEDVHIEDGFLWIDSDPERHETKDREGRWVPMTPQLREAYRDHMAAYRMASYRGRRSPWVFHHTLTRRQHSAGERIISMRESFKGAAKRAGLPARFGQHDLRHLRVTTWLAEGKNPVHVKEAVGHSDLRTTMGYTHLAREHLRSLVDDDVGRKKNLDVGEGAG